MKPINLNMLCVKNELNQNVCKINKTIQLLNPLLSEYSKYLTVDLPRNVTVRDGLQFL